MIKLLNLSWSNWFSYGDDNYLDFTENKVTQLVGDVGAGKSSIPLILQEVLYGKNVKGIKKADIRNRNKKVNANAVLKFSKLEDIYTINVTRKLSGVSLSLHKGEDNISHHKATDTYKEIESILGLDFNLFSQLTYQSSKASLSFLTDTDTNRKKFLISLFSLEQYVELHNKYKEFVKEINSKVDSISGSISTINKWLQTNETLDLQEIKLKDILPIEGSILKDKEILVGKLATLETTNEAILKNNKYKQLLVDIAPDLLTPPSISRIDCTELRNNIATTLYEISKTKKEKSKVEKLGTKCITCGHEIDKEAYRVSIRGLKDSVSTNEAKVNKLNTELNKANVINQQWKKHKDAVLEFEGLTALINESISETLMIEDSIKLELWDICKEIDKYNYVIADIREYNSKATKNNTKKQVIDEQLSEYKSQLEVEVKALKETQSLSSYLVLLRDIFSNKGLVSFKIQYLVQDLQVEIAKYLSRLSSGRFQVEFKLSGDKLNIVIYDNGAEIDINSLSSGETSKINIATLLAVRALMSSIANTQMNILFLDESINTLDSESMDSLVECLMDEVNLNIFLMSHSFTNPLINVINVIKEGDISRLHYGR